MNDFRTHCRLVASAVILFFLPRVSAFAWNSAGHMIVASFAYDQLPPDVQQQVTAVLQGHPEIAKWVDKMPRDLVGLDLGRYLFMRASVWPDEIRGTHSEFDHPKWHYIDYSLEPPDFAMEPPPDVSDILFGLEMSEKEVSETDLPPMKRAAYTSWIIHLVGDIHQPLHCAELVTAQFPLPEGDRGGNLFWVGLAGNPMNLHAIWDGLPGHDFDIRDLLAMTAALEKRFPRSELPELAAAKDPKAWSLESRALAISEAYLNGKLQGEKYPLVTLPPLPEGYLVAAKTVADRRLALASYRLADFLRRMAAKL